MKRMCSQGVVGVKRKRAEPISIEKEEILWEKGLLGEDSPKVLLDTMIYRFKKWTRTQKFTKKSDRTH